MSADGATQDAVVARRNRDAARMAVLTGVSRATGFARVVVVAAVLGTSYLGNTYQSANTIPNILFELFAAGVLQAVLVPIMVEAVDHGSHQEAEETAGVVLGAILSMLAAVVAAGLVAGPWIMRLLVSGVDSAAVAAAEVRLGTFLLWFFLPQILFYAANLVATAVLNATGHFALPVFAPTVNNVVVITSYLIFAAMRHGEPPSLFLTLPEKLVLALGTSLGVVAFCAVPVIGARRVGYRLRPRFNWKHPTLRRLARQGLWAAGFLAFTQVLLVVVLYLANGSEGGVVVYQLAFVLFMLPNSLFAVPVFTTAFPALTRFAGAGDWPAFATEVGRAARAIAFFTVVSAGALIALSGPIADLVALGNASGRTTEVAGAIAGFAVGLPGFSLLLFLTRVSYSYANTRTPTVVNLVVAVVGSIVMALLVTVAPDPDRITVIGVGYGVAQTVGALLLALAVRSQLHEHAARVRQVALPLARIVVATAIASGATYLLVRAVAPSGIAASAVTVAVGGVLVGGIALVLSWVAGGPAPQVALRTLGGDPGRFAGPGGMASH
jgi:putative peptidoglycan lipid II flippase